MITETAGWACLLSGLIIGALIVTAISVLRAK